MHSTRSLHIMVFPPKGIYITEKIYFIISFKISLSQSLHKCISIFQKYPCGSDNCNLKYTYFPYYSGSEPNNIIPSEELDQISPRFENQTFDSSNVTKNSLLQLVARGCLADVKFFKTGNCG